MNAMAEVHMAGSNAIPMPDSHRILILEQLSNELWQAVRNLNHISDELGFLRQKSMDADTDVGDALAMHFHDGINAIEDALPLLMQASTTLNLTLFGARQIERSGVQFASRHASRGNV